VTSLCRALLADDAHQALFRKPMLSVVAAPRQAAGKRSADYALPFAIPVGNRLSSLRTSPFLGEGGKVRIRQADFQPPDRSITTRRPLAGRWAERYPGI